MPNYSPHVEGMLQDALMLDELGHQYGMAELHKAAEEIWDRAFNVIEQTHGAAERERAAYQVGYRTPVPLESFSETTPSCPRSSYIGPINVG